VLGGLGALVGIALGIPAAFAGRPVIEEHLAHARAGGYRVFPTALLAIAALAVVTGVLAAVVPAFITARQNIITSLAGRRGITRSRKRWLVLGIATCALGTFIVTVGTSRVDTRIMLVGIILGELGLVLCTPSLVGLIARVGRLLPLGPRIALRDAARNRAAAAPAISAVMAAVAGSVAIGLYLTSNVAQQRDEYPQRLPIGYVEMYLGKSGGPVSADRLAHADQLLRSTMPVAQTYPVSMQACAPSEPADAYCSLVVRKAPAYTCPYDDIVTSRPLTKAEVHAARADSRCDTNPIGNVSPDVDDGTALAALTGASGDDLRRGQAMLRAGGIVVTDPSYIDNGQVTVEVTEQRPNDTAPPTARSLTLPAYLLTTAFGKGPMIASPKAMQTAGMGSVVTSMVAVTTRMPTTEEQDRLRGTVAGEAGFFVETGPPITVDARIWILMGAAAAITLAAAAVGTALAAADGRQDLSTLAAVGASPRLRRSLSLSQSGVIAGLGSLLGALAGTGAAVAILAAFNATIRDEWPGPPTMPVALPWAALIVALLVVPSIAMIGAGTLTGSRLPIERRT
jgi:putative ABC transport system permease protein